MFSCIAFIILERVSGNFDKFEFCLVSKAWAIYRVMLSMDGLAN